MGKSCARSLERKGKWTEAEELILANLHQELGNKWASISKHLPERTDSDVKNHWFSTLRSKSDSKMQTFLWIYAKKVESVAESHHARKAIFTEATAEFISLGGFEGFCKVSGLQKTHLLAHCQDLGSDSAMEEMERQGDAGRMNLIEMVNAGEPLLAIESEKDADPNLLNGDISDDLMLKLMESSSEDDGWMGPSSPVQMMPEEAVAIDWTLSNHGSHTLSLSDGLGSVPDQFSEHLNSSPTAMSGRFPGQVLERLSPKLASPDAAALKEGGTSNENGSDRSAAPLCKGQTYHLSSSSLTESVVRLGNAERLQGSSSVKLKLSDTLSDILANEELCPSSPRYESLGLASPAVGQPRAMFSLLMQHLDCQRLVDGVEEEVKEKTEDSAFADEAQLASTYPPRSSIRAEKLVRAPLQLLKRRCLSHPFCGPRNKGSPQSNEWSNGGEEIASLDRSVGCEFFDVGSKDSMEGVYSAHTCSTTSAVQDMQLLDDTSSEWAYQEVMFSTLRGPGCQGGQAPNIKEEELSGLYFLPDPLSCFMDCNMEPQAALPEWVV